MHLDTVLSQEASAATGPDLTRYLLVCASLIAGLIALAWFFRRFIAEKMKVRASKRSLQVLDVLPLSRKQKLVVVRCYDRSFLLGLGEKEVRSIAELDAEAIPGASGGRSFSGLLETEIVPEAPPAPQRASDPGLGSKDGVLA